MSRHVRLSAVLLVSALAASCGGGGTENAPAASKAPSAASPAPAAPSSSLPQPGNLPPVFVSGGGGNVRDRTMMSSYRALATDPEGASVTYAIAGGADAAYFAIDANTGELRFVTPPHFDAPSDADRNNTYQVTISASDGVNTTKQDVSIGVTDIEVTL